MLLKVKGILVNVVKILHVYVHVNNYIQCSFIRAKQ